MRDEVWYSQVFRYLVPRTSSIYSKCVGPTHSAFLRVFLRLRAQLFHSYSTATATATDPATATAAVIATGSRAPSPYRCLFLLLFLFLRPDPVPLRELRGCARCGLMEAACMADVALRNIPPQLYISIYAEPNGRKGKEGKVKKKTRIKNKIKKGSMIPRAPSRC